MSQQKFLALLIIIETIWDCSFPWIMLKNKIVLCPGGGGGGWGGYSGFQVTDLIEWEEKQDPQKSLALSTKPKKKIPGPKINPPKIPC